MQIDLWQGSRPWYVLRYNSKTLKWESIGQYGSRSQAEQYCGAMQRACKGLDFKVVFESETDA